MRLSSIINMSFRFVNRLVLYTSKIILKRPRTSGVDEQFELRVQFEPQ